MSKDLHLHCLTHGNISDELGHAAGRALFQLRDFIARRQEIIQIWETAYEEFELSVSDIWDSNKKNTLHFLREHPDCDIQIRDEYGTIYDLSVEPTECFAFLSMFNGFKLTCDLDQADNHRNHQYIGPDDRGVEFKVTWHAFKEGE